VTHHYVLSAKKQEKGLEEDSGAKRAKYVLKQKATI
jgi:hypothetical protein